MKKLVAILCVLVTSCGGGAGGSVAPPNGGNGPTPPPAQHLYVADEQTPGTINSYLLPLTAASRPIAILAGISQPASVALDSSGRLFVANLGNTVQVFAQPVLNASAPAFTLTVPAVAEVALDERDDLFAGDVKFCGLLCVVNDVSAVPAPVGAGSAVTYSFATGHGFFARIRGVAVDPSGNLWVESMCNLSEFTQPFSSASTSAFATVRRCVQQPGVAFDSGGRLFSNETNGVDVYDPPLTSASVPAFTIPVQTPQGVAFDRSGNLYVSSGGNLVEFSPPFSAASIPVLTVATPTGAAGIAIGP